MSADSWSILQRAGVPQGSTPSSEGWSDGLSEAVADLATHVEDLDGPQRDALHAWLGAFQQHWPQLFSRLVGAPGAALRAHLDACCRDPNRYLKLRRIAIANIARRLEAAVRTRR